MFIISPVLLQLLRYFKTCRNKQHVGIAAWYERSEPSGRALLKGSRKHKRAQLYRMTSGNVPESG